MRRSLISMLGLAGMLLNPIGALAQESRTPLTFWCAVKAPYAEQYTQMVKGYEAEHPHVVIEVRTFSDEESLRAALAGSGALPDVALIDNTWQDELIAGGKLEPVEDLMAEASSMARIVFKADTFPALFQLSLKDGKLWTMPTFCTDTALVYNTQMFTAKKIKKVPANWGQMVADAKLLTDPVNGVWGFQLPLGETTAELGHLYSLMLWQMGTNLLDTVDANAPIGDSVTPASLSASPPPTPGAVSSPAVSPVAAPPAASPTAGSVAGTPAASPTAGSVATTPAVTPTAGSVPAPPAASANAAVASSAPPTTLSPNTLAAASPTPLVHSVAAAVPSPSPVAPGQKSPSERLVGFLNDMVYRYKVSSVAPTSDFSKCAMYLGTPETLLAAESQGLTMMAAPFPMNKVKVEELTVYSFAITKDARDKREAYQFANWVADFQRSVVWTTSTPYLPANKQVTLSPDYFQYLTKHPGLRIFLSEMGVGRLQPLAPRYRRILTEVGGQLKTALTQHEDVEQAVQAIADKTHYLLNMPQTRTEVHMAQ